MLTGISCRCKSISHFSIAGKPYWEQRLSANSLTPQKRKTAVLELCQRS